MQPKFGSDNTFFVCHYAGDVKYTTATPTALLGRYLSLVLGLL